MQDESWCGSYVICMFFFFIIFSPLFKLRMLRWCKYEYSSGLSKPNLFYFAMLIRHSNNNEKLRSFKSKENIHKKEVWPYHSFGY